MRRFNSSLSMCFPHKYWVKEWQTYHNKKHDDKKCKEKNQKHRIIPPVSYVYDDKTQHRCFVCQTPRSDSLTVSGWKAYHICVDGGLIRYGVTNYMFDDKYPQGRCDSIIFDNHDLWFVELKMNITTSLDGQIWKNMTRGMEQLRDFICNLRCKLAKKRTPLNRYFGIHHQHCTICMNKYPNMSSSRNNQLERFRLETGVKLQQLVVIP